MLRRKRARLHSHPLGDAPEGCTYHYKYALSARKVAVGGVAVRLRSIRGNFIFLRHVVKDNGVEWIDLQTPRGGWLSVRPDQVIKLAPVTRKVKK